MRYLFFAAHPDDAEELMGATAFKLCRAGHAVKFVSVCNGDCGHYDPKYRTPEGHAALAARRLGEAQKSAELSGITDYQVLNFHDCAVEASLAAREQIVRIIRIFQPDVVISHRDCDYHADHRATGRLVMDAAYLLKVPLYCEDTPIPAKNPVFAYSFDPFQEPSPFAPDVAVEVDSVLETKLKMMDCHVSQFYEWLPWDNGFKDFKLDMNSWTARKEWLISKWFERDDKRMADEARSILIEEYGEKGKNIRYAETFKQSEYGARVSREEFRKMFLAGDTL